MERPSPVCHPVHLSLGGFRHRTLGSEQRTQDGPRLTQSAGQRTQAGSDGPRGQETSGAGGGTRGAVLRTVLCVDVRLHCILHLR